MALGAEPASVYRLIVGETARLAATGIVMGIGASIEGVTLIRGLFYRIRPWDLPTFLVVAAIFIVVTLVASYIPAHRAASVSPLEAGGRSHTLNRITC